MGCDNTPPVRKGEVRETEKCGTSAVFPPPSQKKSKKESIIGEINGTIEL